MMRVSHGGQHYGVSITNRMIHRGCRHGNEETMCDQIRSHLGPLTVGEVFCKVELCEGDLCNVGDWGEEEEEIGEEGGIKNGEEKESRGNNGGEVGGREDYPGQTGRNNGIAAAQTNFDVEKVDEKTEKKKMNKKKRGKNKKGGKNKKTKRKKRRKVKPAKMSKRRKLN